MPSPPWRCGHNEWVRNTMERDVVVCQKWHTVAKKYKEHSPDYWKILDHGHGFLPNFSLRKPIFGESRAIKLRHTWEGRENMSWTTGTPTSLLFILWPHFSGTGCLQIISQLPPFHSTSRYSWGFIILRVKIMVHLNWEGWATHSP